MVYDFGIKTIELVTNHFLTQKEILDAGNVWDNLPPRQHVALVAWFGELGFRKLLDGSKPINHVWHIKQWRGALLHTVHYMARIFGPKALQVSTACEHHGSKLRYPWIGYRTCLISESEFLIRSHSSEFAEKCGIPVYPQIAIWTCRAPYFGPTNLSSDWLMGISSLWMFMDYSNLEYTR